MNDFFVYGKPIRAFISLREVSSIIKILRPLDYIRIKISLSLTALEVIFNHAYTAYTTIPDNDLL